ncbi:MAG: fluoride efflux transporter CrcB [Actinobacteria bacterium]|uniref:Unannotated protein n=1 Tax=freshwater metagenome TaxID=449393 RepID=A0A6J7AKB1_9ZZZZ|nr:fluoride efflux transporter CrcB [Actinomycetota bacterium]
MEQMRTLGYIAVGGIIGSLGRYGLDLLVAGNLPLEPQDFPLSTLAVNLIGCLAIGILAPVLLVRTAWPNARPFLITGILGGFTTFSALAAQSGVLLLDGQGWRAAAYLVATLAGGLLAVRLGMRISGRQPR